MERAGLGGSDGKREGKFARREERVLSCRVTGEKERGKREGSAGKR